MSGVGREHKHYQLTRDGDEYMQFSTKEAEAGGLRIQTSLAIWQQDLVLDKQRLPSLRPENATELETESQNCPDMAV